MKGDAIMTPDIERAICKAAGLYALIKVIDLVMTIVLAVAVLVLVFGYLLPALSGFMQ